MSEKKENPGAGVLLVTHGVFGKELINAASSVLGPQDGLESVAVDVEIGVDETVEAIRGALKRIDSGKGVLILTDLFGGSPTTLSLSLLKTENVEVVTGVNLPMLVKALQSRQMQLAKLAQEASEAGKQGIKVAGELLRGKGRKQGKH